ncbi:MAG: diacylglycerol kinase family protein [Oscillospiraceae bacterium]|nr:diacylglycerol kinase family protein [Oscillospiraceae bacterium]
MTDNLKKLLRSFKYAAAGIIYSIKTQRNMRFHIGAAGAVLMISQFYEFTRGEYALLMIIFALVICSEMINTAIEKTVDLVSEDYHVLAEKAKDCAAGAVLISAFFAAAAGVFLFWDTSVFADICDYFINTPVYIGVALLYLVLWIWFVLGYEKEEINEKK